MNETLTVASQLVYQRASFEKKHILEFGMYEGRSIKQIRSQFDDTYQIFGFDSFQGLPIDWEGTTLKKGYFSTNGVIPSISGVTIFPGWFKDTLPEYLKIAKPIALLHIDCDLYESTKEVLYALTKYIVKDTIIVFDEWYFNHRDIPENRTGEQKAFYEWANDKNIYFAVLDEIEDERRIVEILGSDNKNKHSTRNGIS